MIYVCVCVCVCVCVYACQIIHVLSCYTANLCLVTTPLVLAIPYNLHSTVVTSCVFRREYWPVYNILAAAIY